MNKDVFIANRFKAYNRWGDRGKTSCKSAGHFICYIEIQVDYSSYSQKKGVSPSMPGVLVRDDEPFERALKRFKKACEKAGVISDMKKNQHFEKPSERRKRKIAAARRKRIKLDQQYTR